MVSSLSGARSTVKIRTDLLWLTGNSGGGSSGYPLSPGEEMVWPEGHR